MAVAGNHRLLLLAALVGALTLEAMPLPADRPQATWIDQIAFHVITQQETAAGEGLGQAYSRYLVQLQTVRAAVTGGNLLTVHNEMNRLIEMLGAKEGGISDSSASSLLYHVALVTPRQYLDDVARDRLRIVMDQFELPGDEASGERLHGWNVLTPRRADSGFGSIGGGTFSPIVALGVGILLVTAIGAGILLLLEVRSRYLKGRTITQTMEADGPTAGKDAEAPSQRRHAG